MGGILNHIDSSVVGYTPSLPEFYQLVQDTLGDAGDPADGFEADMAALLFTVPTMEQSLTDFALDFEDMVSEADVFEAVDVDSLEDNFNASVPVIDAFSYNLQLKTIGALQLPALPNPPSGGPAVSLPQPPTCVQAPVSCVPTSPQPPVPTQPPQLPPPVAPPTAQPCPPGFVATQQGCVELPPPTGTPPTFPIPIPPIRIPGVNEPCPEGFIATADGCAEIPQQPPAPAPAPATPPPVVTPPAAPPPCPEGFIETTAGCLPVGAIPGAPLPPPPPPAPCTYTGPEITCVDPFESISFVVAATSCDDPCALGQDPFGLGNLNTVTGLLGF